MNPLPDYTISSRNGYLYVRFQFPPPGYIRTRMRAAGMYFSRSDNVWLADDRMTEIMIIRLIGMNGNKRRKEVTP